MFAARGARAHTSQHPCPNSGSRPAHPRPFHDALGGLSASARGEQLALGSGGRGCWGPCDWCLFGTTFNNRYTAEDARSHWVSNGRSSNSRAEPEEPEDAEGAIQIACSNTQKRAKSPRSIKGGISGARAGGAVSGPGLEFRVNG